MQQTSLICLKAVKAIVGSIKFVLDYLFVNAKIEENTCMKPRTIFFTKTHIINKSTPYKLIFHRDPLVNTAVRPRNGWTPLMWAAIVGHSEVAQLLIQATCDIYARDVAWQDVMKPGETPGERSDISAFFLKKIPIVILRKNLMEYMI